MKWRGIIRVWLFYVLTGPVWGVSLLWIVLKLGKDGRLAPLPDFTASGTWVIIFFAYGLGLVPAMMAGITQVLVLLAYRSRGARYSAIVCGVVSGFVGSMILPLWDRLEAFLSPGYVAFAVICIFASLVGAWLTSARTWQYIGGR